MACSLCSKEISILVGCKGCSSVFCKKCVKDFLSSSLTLPLCPSCSMPWSIQFVSEQIGDVFIKKIRHTIESLLWEREEQYFPSVTPYVEYRKKIMDIDHAIKEKERQIHLLSKDILSLRESRQLIEIPHSPFTSTLPHDLEYQTIEDAIQDFNYYKKIYCPNYQPVYDLSKDRLEEFFSTHYPKQLSAVLKWYQRVQTISAVKDPKVDSSLELCVQFHMNELSKEDYQSKLFLKYKLDQQKREEYEKKMVYIVFSKYFLHQLYSSDNVIENMISNLLSIEEEMRYALL